MNTNENIIEIEGLSKSFGSVKAVKDISFSVRRGELFAFLGVNGAGKSTTISIICGQLSKDRGTVKINGHDLDRECDAIRSEIGVVFQNSALDRALTVRDNLSSRAALYGIHGKDFDNRLLELCKLLDLEPLIKRPVGKLSGGQRRRIDIARALLHHPKILILDEPTTGLDPQTRKTVWSTIDALRRNDDMTVFLTTHYMEEAADADRVIILDGGTIAASGTPIELKNQFSGDFITIYGVNEEQIKLLSLPYESLGGAFRISVANTAEATALILAHPELFLDYEITKGKMDDVFLAATGKTLSSEGPEKKKRGDRK